MPKEKKEILLKKKCLFFYLHLDCDGCVRLITLQDEEATKNSEFIKFFKGKLYEEILKSNSSHCVVVITNYSSRTRLKFDSRNTRYFSPEELWLPCSLLKLLTYLTNSLASSVQERLANEGREVSITVCLSGSQLSDLPLSVTENQTFDEEKFLKDAYGKSGTHLCSIIKNIYSETPSEYLKDELGPLERLPYGSDSFVYIDQNDINPTNDLSNFLPNFLFPKMFPGYVFYNENKFYVIRPDESILQTEKEMLENSQIHDKKKFSIALFQILYQHLTQIFIEENSEQSIDCETVSFFIDDRDSIRRNLKDFFSNKTIQLNLPIGNYYIVDYRASFSNKKEEEPTIFEEFFILERNSFSVQCIVTAIQQLLEAAKANKIEGDDDFPSISTDKAIQLINNTVNNKVSAQVVQCVDNIPQPIETQETQQNDDDNELTQLLENNNKQSFFEWFCPCFCKKGKEDDDLRHNTSNIGVQ